MKKKYFMLLLVLSGIPFSSWLQAQDSLFINFTGMTPHVNQDLTLYLRDTVSGDISDTVIVSPVATADFQVSLGPIVTGNSYYLDFYADYNENGMYDVPPVDHAWRIVLDSVEGGDTTITFAHNTDFTDITWMGSDSSNMITLNFTGMTPHIGQDLSLYIRNMDDGISIDSMVMMVDNADFSVDFDSVPAGDYNLDFYADLNQNGMYDSPPADHAWRIELAGFMADTVLEFAHNTDFTDIFPDSGSDTVLYQIAVNFTGMTPHVGQNLYMYIRYADDGEYLDSLSLPVDAADFNVVFDSVPGGDDYNFDFYADLNQNGMYDAPPTDHAWRIELPGFDSDTTLDFAHNTDFTDIFAVDTTVGDTYTLTISFVDMDPHVDQDLILYLRDPLTGDFVDSVKVEPVESADFEVEFDSVAIDTDYNLDFYADLNQNGMYDVPPVDHAWRIELTGIMADTTIEFVHNTEFTDIGLGVPTPIDDIEDLGFSAYPNPVKDALHIQLERSGSDLSIYNVTGAIVLHKSLNPAERVVRLNVSALKPGMYILKLKTDSGTGEFKFLKE
jgi:hypothetical protein